MDSTSAASSLSWPRSDDAGGDSVTATEPPSFSGHDLVCRRVLLLVGVVGGLSISVFVGVASVGNDFL